MRHQLRPLAALELLEPRLQPAVTYHGGALLTHVEAQAVYLGSDWQSSAGQTQAHNLDGFVGYVVNSPYFDALTNAGYGVGRGTASAGAVLPVQINKSYYLTDAQIQRDLQAAITSGAVQQPDANRLYVIYVEPGVAIKDGGGATSVTDFLGYHGAFAGRDAAGRPVDVHYAVMPYPGGYNPSAQSQGFASNFDALTAVSSHEIAEAATDPNVNYKAPGWYDDRYNAEIGDLTEGYVRRLNGYDVQLVVNKQDQVLSLPTIAAPTTTTGGTIHQTTGTWVLVYVGRTPVWIYEVGGVALGVYVG